LEGFVVVGSPLCPSLIEGVVVEVVVVVGFVVKWPLPLDSQFVIFCCRVQNSTGQPKGLVKNDPAWILVKRFKKVTRSLC
jgi:hypothetical protein